MIYRDINTVFRREVDTITIGRRVGIGQDMLLNISSLPCIGISKLSGTHKNLVVEQLKTPQLSGDTNPLGHYKSSMGYH